MSLSGTWLKRYFFIIFKCFFIIFDHAHAYAGQNTQQVRKKQMIFFVATSTVQKAIKSWKKSSNGDYLNHGKNLTCLIGIPDRSSFWMVKVCLIVQWCHGIWMAQKGPQKVASLVGGCKTSMRIICLMLYCIKLLQCVLRFPNNGQDRNFSCNFQISFLVWV